LAICYVGFFFRLGAPDICPAAQDLCQLCQYWMPA